MGAVRCVGLHVLPEHEPLVVVCGSIIVTPHYSLTRVDHYGSRIESEVPDFHQNIDSWMQAVQKLSLLSLKHSSSANPCALRSTAKA
jgi:hypothetical protein